MTTTRHWVIGALLLASVGIFAPPSSAQQVIVGISGTGAIRFTDASALVCDATTEGSIRYEDASNRVEFCDDTVWTVLGPGGVGTIYVNDLADAVTDYVTDHNMRIGSNTAMTAGAANNLFIGESAGTSGTTNAADNNIAIGYQALDALTTGSTNTAVGVGVLSGLAGGSSNTAVGYTALTSLWGGTDNTAVGAYALSGATNSSADNTGVGSGALQNVADGASNVAVGRRALYTNSASSNTAVGTSALYTNGAGANNTVVGRSAMYNNDTGNNNIAVGYQAGDLLTTGSSNIVIGYDVDPPANNTSNHLNIGGSIYGDLANDRIRIGGSGAVSSGPFLVEPPATETIAAAATITANACGTIKAIQSTGSVTTNTTNTFTAPAAGNSGCCMVVTNVDAADTITLDVNANFITGAGTDIAVGPGDGVQVCSNGTTWYQGNALSSLASSGSSIDGLSDATYDTGADHNMRLGSNTAMTAGAAQNLFIGESAGTAGTTNAADRNIAVGYQALDALTTGADNIAIGAGALGANDTGNGSVAIGTDALATFTYDSSYSVAIGHHAFYGANGNNTQGVAIGGYALDTAWDQDHVAVGYRALYGAGNSSFNTAIGNFALETAGGSNNTAVGQSSLNLATGSNNTAIGYASGDNLSTGASSNIVIGASIDAMSATGSSQLNIGDTIYGDLANDRIRIGGSGAVSAGPLLVEPPATETIAAAGTITANACGTIKAIQSTGNVTTNTTNTFTAPAAANSGCCMVVTNVDTADTITLDVNANFITGAGTDIAVGPGDGVQVCSNGTTWYQGNALSSLSAGGGGAIDGLSDATYDTGADHNMRLGSNTAMTAGAAQNLFIGESAGTAGTTNAADRNIAVGYQALDALTTGADNIAIGAGALGANDTGNGSVAIGTDALATFTYDSSYSVAIGHHAFYGANGNNTQGVAIGGYALDTAWDQDHVAVGYRALYGAGNSSFNTAIGNFALETAGGSNNTAVGQSSLNLATGSNNTAIGYASGDNLSTGASSNIVIGASIDAMSATGSSQLNIGDTIYGDLANDRIRIGGSGAVSAGPLLVEPPATETIAAAGTITANACGTIKAIQSTGNVTTNTTNTFTAPAAANSGCCMVVTNVDTADTITLDVNANFITGAGTDIAVGPGDGVQVCSNGTTWYQGNALSSLSAGGGGAIDGLSDAATDYTALVSNFWMGQNAGASIAAGGTYNMAIGQDAGDAISTGDYNLAIGPLALSAVTTGAANTAVGVGALTAYTMNNSTAVGALSQFTNESGQLSTSVGYQSLFSNQYADGNTAIGANALRLTTSGYNTAVGFEALDANVDGVNSVAVGVGALKAQTTGGTRNTAFGYQAGDNITTGDDNLIIGYDLNAMSATGSNQLNIGDTIYGDLANDRIRIGGSGAVSAGPLLVEPPATETIAAAGTITANACGTIKAIQSTGNVTTNTTNTFTAPAAANSGCCMVVTNVDTADTITLDVNANFITGAGTDIAVGPGDGVQVCSNGTTWYQGNALSSLSAGGGGAIDGLSDATYDTGADHNMRLGSNTAMTAGAAQNLFIGESAGTAGTTNAADRNIAVGYQALDALTTGADNIAIGAGALGANDTGNGSVAIGTDALATFTYDSSYSVAIGHHAFYGANGNNTQGVAIGGYALDTAWDQDHVAVGYRALYGAGNSSFNTAIGNFALETAGGSNNTAVGQSSLNLATGSNNTAIGYASGDNLSTGASSNIVIGASIDAMSATGSSQLNIGDTIYGDLANDRIRIGGSGAVSAGPLLVEPPATETIAAAGTITANACGTIKAIQSTGNVTTNTTNTFTAPAAANSGCCMVVTNVDTADTITLDVNANFITGAGTDIAVGPGDGVQVCSNGTTWYQGNALSSLSAGGGGAIDGLSDAATDYTALVSNFWMGQNAGASIAAGGTYNMAIGQDAGDAISTGDYNLAIGPLALSAVTTGAANTAVGVGALTAYTMNNSTAVGALSQFTNESGQLSTSVGYQSLFSNQYADGNTAIGANALRLTTSGYNTAVGFEALDANVDGVNSVAVGVGALKAQTTGGTRNTAFGYQAGDNITTGDDNLIIGYDLNAMSATGSNQLNIGDSIYGDLANDRIRIGGTGTVAAGPLYAVPPATETIAGAAVITANACGTIKPVQSTGSVTTNTTNTFTGSTVAGCCMDVISVDAADTVTLDANALFKTIGGADQALGPYDSVRVCSDGTTWYQMGAVSGNQ